MTLALTLPQLSQITTCSLYTCAHACAVLCSVAQSCLTLCDPMDCSPPGSSVHEILQARILEWVAKPFSRESSWLRDWSQVSCRLLYWQVDSLPLSHLGSPLHMLTINSGYKARDTFSYFENTFTKIINENVSLIIIKSESKGLWLLLE